MLPFDPQRKKLSIPDWLTWAGFVGDDKPSEKTITNKIKAGNLDGCFFAGRYWVYIDEPDQPGESNYHEKVLQMAIRKSA